METNRVAIDRHPHRPSRNKIEVVNSISEMEIKGYSLATTINAFELF